MIPIVFLIVARQGVIVTPFAQSEPLGLGRIVPATSEATRWSPVDLSVDAHATFVNPFDPDDVALDAKITQPDGKSYTIPGFFSEEFTRQGNDLTGGQEGWHVRFCPTSSGMYTVAVTLKDGSGSTTSTPITIPVKDGPGHGFVRVSPRDRRYFEFDDGRAYYPIGANVAWGGQNGIASYDSWFPKYGSQGANWARLWLGPAWTTFALEVGGKPEAGKGIGLFDLANAYRLDQALDLAKKNGLYLQLCLDSYNELRDRDAANYWEQTPQNQDNGGPLRIWTEFWTSSKMERLYRNKLRYLVARYSAYPQVFGWEFWNEVDITRDFDEDVVRGWHERMGSALRAIDPYHHLIATSFANTNGVKSIDLLPQIDYIQTHHYSAEPVNAIVYQQTRKTTWGKPHFVAEVGADAAGPRAQDDPDGLQVHDPQWASVAIGASGTAMPWWWDSLIEPKNLYPLFGAVSRFVSDVDWPGEEFRQAWPQTSYLKVPNPPLRRDLSIDGQVSWDRQGVNRPKTVHFSNGKLSGELPIAGIQHGIVNHPDLHNPIRFVLDLPRPTRFEVQVGDVSGYGGANLRVFLDGERVLSRDFADPDGDAKTGTLTQYRGSYGITVPAGHHSVIVQNDGRDWFLASYRLVGVIADDKPPLSGFAITGNRTALVWLRVEDRTWKNVADLKRRIPSCPPTVMRLPGLSAGRWSVEYWNTWTGRITRTDMAGVGNNGVLRVVLPTIAQDLALKIRKVDK